MEEFPWGAHYEVTVPPGGGSLAWLRKAIEWPFTRLFVEQEAARAHASLAHRYADLERLIGEVRESQETLRRSQPYSRTARGSISSRRRR